MKVAPITYTEIGLGLGVLILGYIAYKTYQGIQDGSITKTVTDAVSSAGDYVVTKSATAVDVRNDPGDSPLKSAQNWFADTVMRGQDAGATSFTGAFFKGLFT